MKPHSATHQREEPQLARQKSSLRVLHMALGLAAAGGVLVNGREHADRAGRDILPYLGVQAMVGGPVWQEVDDLNEVKDYDGAHAVLQTLKSKHIDDVDYIWRMARHHFNMSDNTTVEAVTKRDIYTGFEYAQRALETDSTSAAAYGWYGILIGRVGEIEGTEQKIRNSYQVRTHTLKAIVLDPEADAWHHVMGRWHFTLADLSWFERTIAAIIYTTPPEASFEEAETFFARATELDPRDIRHFLWLAKTRLELGKQDAARVDLEKALALPARSESDVMLRSEARKLLEAL